MSSSFDLSRYGAASVEDVPEDYRDSFPEIEENLPAMQTLGEQQTELSATFAAGFDSRSEILKWAVEVGVYTLGEFDHGIIDGMIHSRLGLGLLIGPEYYPPGATPLGPADAERIREAILAVDFHPHAVASQRRMRYLAVQYDLRIEARPESDGQRHPGMRPLLSEIYERQIVALERFLDGFESLGEFRAWLSWTVEATWAELDPAFADRILAREPTLAELVIEDSSTALAVRESLAAEYLLPAFSKAAATAAESAAEVSERAHEVARGSIR